MNVLLLNDTRVDPNPGCQATVSTLVRMLSHVSGRDVATRPIGFGYHHFADLVQKGLQHSVDAWQGALARMADDLDIAHTIASADLIVVNLEGTFHHHAVGALALGGLMALAHRMRKRVWAVNGTVEGIDSWLLGAALAPAEHVAVREPRSHRWLEDRRIAATLAADCAFVADILQNPDDTLRAARRPRAVLYTPGVLASAHARHALSTVEVLRHFDIMARLGWHPVYFLLDAAERATAIAVEQAGWPVESITQTTWKAIGHYIGSFELVISGRYHMLIFAALAGVPFVGLPSHTWKIEGLLEHVGRPTNIAQDDDELDAVLRNDVLRRKPTTDALEECRARALLNVPIAMDPAVLRATRPSSAADRFADEIEALSARTSSAALDQLANANRGLERLLWAKSEAWLRTCPRPVRVGVFGASARGQQDAARLTDIEDVAVTCFLDNDARKWDQALNGLRIARPTADVLDMLDAILISSMYQAEIVAQVAALGHAHKIMLDVGELVATRSKGPQ